MNKRIYSLIWNQGLGHTVVASELAVRHHGGASHTAAGCPSQRRALLALALLAAIAAPLPVLAGETCTGPTGASAPGSNAVACGTYANASGYESTALGNHGTASGRYSIALGTFSAASGVNSSALGSGSVASSSNNTALGGFSKASGAYNSTALGAVSAASGINSTAVGVFSTASGAYSTALGVNSRAGTYGIALGSKSLAFGANSTALGVGSIASGDHSIASGGWIDLDGDGFFEANEITTASGAKSSAFGVAAQATADNSVALGATSIADRTDTVSVGAAGSERQIVNVAAGTMDNDAVIVSQLYPFTTALGGGASFSGGVFVAPTYTIQGASYQSVGDAFGAVDTSLTDLYNKVAAVPQGPQGPVGPQGPGGPQGPAGPAGGGPNQVTYDSNSHNTLTLNGANGTVISNVANGVAATDAVNVGQMQAGDANALSQSKTYTDTQTQEALNSAKTYANAGDTTTLNAAKAYTDQQIANAMGAGLDQFEQQVNARFGEVDRRIDRIGAASAAWAGLASSTSGPGANSLGVGFGSQGGQQAMAVGYRRTIDSHLNLTIGGAVSGSEHSVSAGAGFNW